MKSLLLQLTILTSTLLFQFTTAQFVCDIPTNGCTNGMFNVDKCECECIEPYCPDWFGDCTNPSGSCGGNPWEKCTRGVDCPWWPNPLKLEACTTGPKVPLDLWEIYNTRTACCNSKYPYSDICDAKEDEGPPTKHPTIQSPEEDDYEVVPIKFDVMGLPDDISMRELKDEMTIVLKRILLRLADRIEGMKVTNVEERVVVTRNLNRGKMRNLLNEEKDVVGQVHHHYERGLEQDVTLYFNVYVVREENRKFGPLIISEIRNSYSEVLEQVQTFADTKFFGGDLNMNWCTSENGQYENCVQDITPSMPARAPAPTVITQSDPPNDGGGLAGWAIALIIIFVLLFVCCVGYAIAVFCFGVANCFGGDYDENKEINNNIYWDDKNNGDNYRGSRGGGGYLDEDNYDDDAYGGRNGRKSRGGRDDRSRRSRGGKSRRSRYEEEENINEGEVQIVLAEPQDPKFDDDSFTINTYGSKLTTMKPGKDPTMYISGQEDKPDPDSSVMGNTTSSRRYYSEDPPLKPKKDPTMYVQGGHGKYSAGDPPLKPKRDPTMFVEGQMDPTMYVEGDGREPSFHVDGQRDPTMYQEDGASVEAFSINQSDRRSVGGYNSADPYGMGGIDDSEYGDPYGFQSNSGLGEEYMTSERDAEYVRGRKDPSYYDDPRDQSFRTQEASVGGSRKKRSKKKKSSRG